MNNKKIHYVFSGFIVMSILVTSPCLAQPYGKGIYDSNVPYGDQTSLSIATNGNVSISITPSSSGQLSKNTSTVIITSTDVVGYKLYIRALNGTFLDSSGSQIPASLNESPSSLAVNSWGYNLDASDNFVGITTSDILIKSTAMPVSFGENTNVTFGVYMDLTKTPGNYSTDIVYTAVPQTD